MIQAALRSIVSIAICLSATASVVHAGTILYSTSGTVTPGYRTNSSWGAGAGYNPTIAMKFTAADTAALTTLTVAASYAGFVTTFEVTSDSSNAPGTILDTFSITGTGASGLYTGSSTSNSLLTSGTSYWLRMRPPVGNTGFWFVSDPGLGGFVSDGNVQFFTNGGLGAFALEGDTGVPEPATTTLVLIAGVGFLIRQRFSATP